MPADLRLLGPAGVAWVGLAALLGAPVRVAGGTSIGCVLLATAVVVHDRTSAPGPGRGWVNSVALCLALCAVALALVLVAAALHRSVQGVGTVTELAEEGATVTVA